MDFVEAYEIALPYLAEMGCSFLFGFIVYASSIGQFQSVSPTGPIIVGVAIGFGSVVLVYTFCDMTLAHFNPAITLAAMVFGKVDFLRGTIFIIAQLCGFMIASATVLGCFSGDAYTLLNVIRPKKAVESVNPGNIICIEAILTGILVFVAFSIAINTFHEPEITDEELRIRGMERKPDRRVIQPLVIGLTLGFLSLLGISSSGGTFNPGLVFPPVLFTWVWYNSWAYWIGEFAGGLAGAAIQVFILKRRF